MGFIPGEEQNAELGFRHLVREGFPILGVQIQAAIIVSERRELAILLCLAGFGCFRSNVMLFFHLLNLLPLLVSFFPHEVVS